MRSSWLFFVFATACFGAAPMGWNSWNSFANIVNSKIVQQQAQTLASNGMKKAGYGDDVGAKGMVHACCMSHARPKFIDALKVREKARATDAQLERVVVLMDGLFARPLWRSKCMVRRS